MICCECRMIHKAQKHIDNELRFYCSTKNNICLKKNRAKGFTWKKVPAQAVSEKKISCKLKIPHPPPPHHFSNGPSLRPHYSERPKRFGSRGPSENVRLGYVTEINWSRETGKTLYMDYRQGLRSSLQFAVHVWTAGRASSGKWLTARVFPLKIVQPHE